MPDRLRAAFNPTRLGGDLASCLILRLMVYVECFFYPLFFLSAMLIEALSLRPGAERPTKRPEGSGLS